MHTHAAAARGPPRKPQGASPTVKQSLSQQNTSRKGLPSLGQRPHTLIDASSIAIIFFIIILIITQTERLSPPLRGSADAVTSATEADAHCLAKEHPFGQYAAKRQCPGSSVGQSAGFLVTKLGTGGETRRVNAVKVGETLTSSRGQSRAKSSIALATEERCRD